MGKNDRNKKYRTIKRISLALANKGYESYDVPIASEFFRQTFSEYIALPNKDIIATLNAYFNPKISAVDLNNRAKATFCLRCYVSHSIVYACKKIDNLFAEDLSFTYRDLLPFVLNDDGITAIAAHQDGKTQLILDADGTTKIATYRIFAVDILQSYKQDSKPAMSLENWTYLRTKQNQELKKFLSEFGFKSLSDWTIINRVRSLQLERLSRRDRILIEAFHQVYRRDRRRKQGQKKVRRCGAPNRSQTREMLDRLEEKKVTFNSDDSLIQELQRIATRLREYDIWSCRESLETLDSETGNYVMRSDLPYCSLSETDIEELETLQFLRQQLRLAITNAIEREIKNSIANLKKSKRYAPFAAKYIEGITLYYCQGKTLKEIAIALEMSNWDRARRVLNPGQLLSRVRESVVRQLLEKILNLASEKDYTRIPPTRDYLKNLAELIEKYADERIFIEATAEIKTGKNRNFSSLYAEAMRSFLSEKARVVSSSN